MMGRPPKSAALRILEGGRGHRPIKTPPEPPQAAVRCPAWLDAEAKSEWRRVAPMLAAMRILTALDIAMLTCYVQAWSELREATDVVQRRGKTFTTPSGYRQQRPEVGIAHRAMLNLRLFCGELGMSPSARMRLATDGRDGGEIDDEGILS
jgi:P27 family predicted phage terminase small subunit